MKDREMLELAAKAAGFACAWSEKYDCAEIWKEGDKVKRFWAPLIDDGDALRLRNRMNAIVANEGCGVYVEISLYPHPTVQIRETFSRDLTDGYSSQASVDAATRRAIVSAAAEIGKAIT